MGGFVEARSRVAVCRVKAVEWLNERAVVVRDAKRKVILPKICILVDTVSLATYHTAVETEGGLYPLFK